MAKITECIVGKKRIGIDDVLTLKRIAKTHYWLVIPPLLCPHCGGTVTAHRASWNGGAHFEHLESKGCPLYSYGRIKKVDTYA